MKAPVAAATRRKNVVAPSRSKSVTKPKAKKPTAVRATISKRVESAQGPATEAPISSAKISQRQLNIRGLNTAWLQSSVQPGTDTRPILFFLHGFPDSAHSWDKQLEALGDDHLVVAPFVRGAWPSEASPDLGRYGVAAGVLDNLAILNHVDPSGRRPVVVIGHDLGVVHAWALIRHLGKRASGLVVINGMDLSQMGRRMLRRPLQLLKSWYIGVFQIPLLPELLLQKFSKQLLRRDRASAIVAPIKQYRSFVRSMPQVAKSDFPRIKCPVLVLWGKDDPWILAPTQDEFDQLAQNAVIRILDGSHWIHRRRADAVNELIRDFALQNESQRHQV